MPHLLLLLLSYAALAGAVTAGCLAVARRARVRRRVAPVGGERIRLSADGGMYRSRVLAVDRLGWWIAAPLRRDAYVPLREGERLRVEVATPAGVLRARTEVVARTDDHRLLLAPPSETYLEDRRHETRRSMEGEPAALDGRPVTLIDLGEGGARLRTLDLPRPGDRVAFAIGRETRFGWVLEAAHGEARIAFEAKETAPANRARGGLKGPARAGNLR